MADHREECSKDKTLENLTCLNYKFTEVVSIFAEKVAKEHPLR